MSTATVSAIRAGRVKVHRLLVGLSRLGLGVLVAAQSIGMPIAAASPAAAPVTVSSILEAPAPTAAIPDSPVTTADMSRYAPGDAAPADSPPLLHATPGVTALAGRVLQTDGIPLRGVLLKLGHARALTDTSGRYLLEDVLPGEAVMLIDGRHAIGGTTREMVDHGVYEVRVTTTAGQTTQLAWTSWLPVIDHVHDVTLTSPSLTSAVATTPDVPGLELRIPKGAVLTDLDGNTVDHVGITAIPINRTPFPLPRDVPVPVYFTAQPGGAVISSVDGTWLGAQVVYPNYTHQLPGARGTFWRYQPDSQGWSPYGTGRVTTDGMQVVPDADTRIYALEGAMFNAGAPPLAGPVPGDAPQDGDPVDLGTGLFVQTQTDLAIADVLPLSLTRTYRPGDYNRHSFGVGMSSQWDTSLWSAQMYQQVDLVSPSGSRVHYTRIIDPANPTDNSYTTAHFTTTAPGPWYGSHVDWNGNGWNVTRRDGLMLVYGNLAPLQYMQDRFGNRIVLTRSGGPNGNITQVSSPNGRFIRFTYDSSGDVLTATDNIGRKVTYTYDSSYRLSTVKDPDGGTTTYTWDSANRVQSITDARGVTFITNTYDSNDRLITQALANNKSYSNTYALDGNGNVTETDVTDPNGNVRKVTFNSAGFMLTDKHATGTAMEEDWIYTRDPTSNLVTALRDPLGRQSTWAYDAYGNVLTQTQLAGTASAATTTFTYSPIYKQLASVQDPLGHATLFMRDPKLETITAVQDPLGHATSFTYNTAGQVLTVKDALGHTTTLTYDHDDLATITDPLARKTIVYTDAIGRQLTLTNPLNAVTSWSYDPIDGVKTMTDANGHTLSTGYSAIGQVTSVTDALNHAISYTYDSTGLVLTRTDPMNTVASVTTRDGKGNITAAKDRKGQSVSSTYDALNRLTGRSYADGSTTAWTYDLGNRTTKLVDSLGGTITRTYDGLNHLLSETTPQGTVSYTYDAAGRRLTMTAGNQAQVSYGYDNANRLTTITQGGTTVSFGYDNANRRTSAALPGGISAAYSYDNANELTAMTYSRGSTTLGILTYTYDLAGRVASRGGTLFQSVLPPALTSATYNAANRLTQRVANGVTVSPAWDANGSLTSDGTNSYVWDARNRLRQMGGLGSFVYDAFGRRQTATRAGQATSFLYDGWDVAQEQQSGAPSANLLLGLGIDERLSRTAGGTTSTYLTDLLGSTLALASGSTPAIATSYGYDAQGSSNVSGIANSNTFQFAGRENDATGLTAMRNRYYNPTWGRFISEDPIGLRGGTNLYAYAGNNSVSSTDPSGLSVNPTAQVPTAPIPYGPTPPTSPSAAGGGNGNGDGNGDGNSSGTLTPDTGSDPGDPSASPSPDSQPYQEAAAKGSKPYTGLRCENCDKPIPGGGAFYPYCYQCYDRSKQEDGGVAPIPPLLDPQKE